MNRPHLLLVVAVEAAEDAAEVEAAEVAVECEWEVVVVCRVLPWDGPRRSAARLLPHDRPGEAPGPPLVHVPVVHALAVDKLVALVLAAHKLVVHGRSLGRLLV